MSVHDGALGSCAYGAECGYVIGCLCGCCGIIHCDCDDDTMAGDENEFTDVTCQCCGEYESECPCEFEHVSGDDRQSGPWEDTVCVTHQRRA